VLVVQGDVELLQGGLDLPDRVHRCPPLYHMGDEVGDVSRAGHIDGVDVNDRHGDVARLPFAHGGQRLDEPPRLTGDGRDPHTVDSAELPAQLGRGAHRDQPALTHDADAVAEPLGELCSTGVVGGR
jgi:hypothetical protein